MPLAPKTWFREGAIDYALFKYRVIPTALFLAGLAMTFGALGADLFSSGTSQFGLSQGILSLVGFGMVLPAVTLTTPAGWEAVLGQSAATSALRVQRALKLGAIAGQTLLLAVVITRFRIENPAFYETVFPLTVVGFVIHHLLPLRNRLVFFLGLSLTTIVAVFGLSNAAWLIGIGLALTAVMHLPISFAKRVALLLAMAAVLIAMRAEFMPAPWSGAIWAILGSMFMFRLMLYLYDLRHTRDQPNIARTLAYFFMLPNVAFPLFPVVDFATFKRTYYDQDAFEIYHRGIRWMVRGVAHLVAYRFVYQHLVISQADVQTSAELARFLLANFLLYLRVSGQFHLIVGMLHLFGFRLPETHRFFYLSSSFTDFWRRINIYWKEFMMKVVYYPAYFRLKKWGDTTALVLATLAVFGATWFLHAYQWFWLLGKFLLSWTDVLFWSILAVLLVVNSLREVRKGRKRVLGTQRWTLKEVAALATRISVTFIVLCTLWSLWTSPTVGDWIQLWQVEDLTALKVVSGLGLVFGSALVLVAVFRDRIRGEDATQTRRAPRGFATTTFANATAIMLIYTLGSPALAERFGVQAQEIVRDLKVTELNKADASLLQRGYYEELVGVNRFNGQLWEVYARRPTRTKLPSLESGKGVRYSETYLRVELRPMIGVPYLNGTFRTNRWGMRDQDYEKTKAAGVYRVALMGPSHVVGWGVLDGQNFESLLEQQLNSANDRIIHSSYEILNFAVPGYSIPQQLIALESRVLDFKPDAVFLVVTPKDGEVAANHLRNAIKRGITIPFDYLRTAAEQGGIVSDMPDSESERRLRPHRDPIIRESYRRFAARARAQNIKPVWVYLSMPGYPVTDDIRERMKQWASESGFELLDLAQIYDGHNLADLQYASWDEHPNTLGHRVIADGMFRALENQPGLLGRTRALLTPQ